MSDERASEEVNNNDATDSGAPDAEGRVSNGTAEAGATAEGASTAEPSGAAGEEPSADQDAPAGEAATQTDLEKAQHERDRMKDQLLRIAADFDNFRKRSRREIAEAKRRAQEDTIREVLPLIDNLERAEQAVGNAEDIEAVADGVKMVLRGFEDVANRLSLTRLKAIGEQFDPNLHDAMQQQETDEHPPGTIVTEIVPGYMLGDRLLRAAMVVVAKPPSQAADAPQSEEEDEVMFVEDADAPESSSSPQEGGE